METPAPVRSTGGHYNAWLLRLWREGEGAWHASLQTIDGGAPAGFADLEQLFAFLLALTETAGKPANERPPERSE